MRCEVDPPGFLVSSCYGRLPERIQSISKNQTGGWARNTEIQPVSTVQTQGLVTTASNGQERSWDGDPDLPLLWFIRDEIGLTGTKFGCGQALCGACTVIVNKQAVRACITSVSDVVDREVTTIEGLHPTGDHAVQKAWREMNVPQCGYCQAGQIMQAAALLMENPKPNHDQIREAMAGNICRCGTYQRIENAVNLASTGV